MTEKLSGPVTMTIEEFGKYIECQNSILIEEKVRKYSLVTFDDESSGSYPGSISKLIGLSSDHAECANHFYDTPSSVKSPQSSLRKKSSPLVFLSSDSSEKKKEKIANPFRSKLFRQKLSFNEIPEEDQCVESDLRNSLHPFKN